MKRFLSLLLVGVIAVSFSACGNNSKDEMLEIANEVKTTEITSAISNNKITAEETYVGNVYKMTGFISAIEKKYIEIGDFVLYLPKEDLEKITVNQKIEVVGKINKIYEDKEGKTFIEMKDSYLVRDTFEITGIMNCRMPYKYDSGYVRTGTWYCNVRTKDGVEYHLEDYIPESDRDYINSAGGFGEYALKASDFGKGTATILGETFTDRDNVTVSGVILRRTANDNNIKPLSIIKNN